MTFIDHKKEALALLTRCPLVTLATIRPDGMPRASSVYATADEKFNFHFVTREDSEKWKNIYLESAVAFACTDEEHRETLQVQGLATRETDVTAEGKSIERLVAMAFRHKEWILPIDQLTALGGYVVVKIKPTWARYSNFADNKPLQQEFEIAKE